MNTFFCRQASAQSSVVVSFSGARRSLFGRLRDFRSFLALLEAGENLSTRADGSLVNNTTRDLGKAVRNAADCAERSAVPVAKSKYAWGTSDVVDATTLSLATSRVTQEPECDVSMHDSKELPPGFGDADTQLLQLLDSSQQTVHPTRTRAPNDWSSVAERANSERKYCIPVSKVHTMKTDGSTSGFEALAALEGLAQGRVWLVPFWGPGGQLRDRETPEDDSELLDLLADDAVVRAGYVDSGPWLSCNNAHAQ